MNPEETAPEGPVETAPAEDAALSDIYDKLTSGGIEEGRQEEAASVDEETKTEAPKPEAEAAAAPEAPSSLPAAIKEAWGQIPEGARDAFVASQKDMSDRLAEAGRVTQGAKPVYDRLVEAVGEFPAMAGMKPAEIADEAFKLAKSASMLREDPIKAIETIAADMGFADQLKAHFSGGSVDAAKKIAVLEKRLAEVEDPQRIDARVNEVTTQRETLAQIQKFAADHKENWSTVEPLMPAMIQASRARLGESASAQDVLTDAYDMAVNAHPDLRAKQAQPADPDRAEAQSRALSVNVKGRSSGKAKPLTEAEAMSAAYDRLMAS